MRPALLTLALVLPLAACGKDDGEYKITPEQIAASNTPLPAPYDTADLDNGKQVFASCRSCHTLAADGPNGAGPNLNGIFGRHIAAKPDYKYSEAAKAADFVWTAEKLDHWLAKPKDFLKGTKMTFAGVKNEKDRIDVIAYLKQETKLP